MQAQWNALLASALLGTEQRKCTVLSPEVEFLAAHETVDRDKDHEAWLLLASAYAATYRRAGQRPPAAQPAQRLAPAPAETKRYCSAAVAARIAYMLTEARTMEPFLEELLLYLIGQERIVPPFLLPELLAWGQGSKSHRALLTLVAGERGPWLARHNPEWKNALQIDPKVAAERAEAARKLSSQQALYDALNITDNIFSRGYSIFKGEGLSGHGRMLQLVVDKLVALGNAGQASIGEAQLFKIAVAVPPVILSELISRLQGLLVNSERSWGSRLVELLEYRQQMLAELNEP
jgi:hypothetical protein